MLRGKPAPVGFAASVSGYLRTYVYRERQGSKTISQLERLNRIDACASLPVGVGDDDPRIRTMALACPGGRWEPSREQKAAIDAAGLNPAPDPEAPPVVLTPDDFLNALAHAAVLDLSAQKQQEMSRVQKSAEATPTQDATISHERARADGAERRCRELEQMVENLRQEVIGEKARRRELQAVLDGDPLPSAAAAAEPPQPSTRRLPAGVRQRGSTYQAYWKIRGRQHQQGGFETAEAAAKHRQQQMEQAELENVVRDAQERRYDPDLTPEQISAMREQATA